MSNFIDVEIDISKAQKALSGTAKSIPSISKKVLTTIAKGTRDRIRSVVRSSIHGDGLIAGKYHYSIAKSIVYGKADSKKGVSIYPAKIEENRKNDLTVPVISTLSYGATIEAVRRKYLIIHGKQIRKVKSVVIKPRNFIQAGELYAESNEYDKAVDKMINKELQKYWGR